LSACLGLCIGCMKFLFPEIHHHFWPKLYLSQVERFFVEFDWPMAKKVETMKATQNRRFYG
jgi:hypothetical protein